MCFDKSITTDIWRRTTKLWKNKLENLCKEYGCTYVDRLIVSVLANSGNKNKKEIAEILCSESQSLTRSLSRLENAKLISIIVSEQDRRFLIYNLTDKGLELYNKIEKANNDIWDTAIKGLSKKNLNTFQNVFMQINHNLHNT